MFLQTKENAQYIQYVHTGAAYNRTILVQEQMINMPV